LAFGFNKLRQSMTIQRPKYHGVAIWAAMMQPTPADMFADARKLCWHQNRNMRRSVHAIKRLQSLFEGSSALLPRRLQNKKRASGSNKDKTL